jgi:hypothetical protein
MIYDLSDTKQAEEAFELLTEFTGREKKVELKVHSARRSNPQNRGLHLLLGRLSNETGYTLEEAKMLYKEMNRDLYFYEKNGHIFIKSSAELTQEEMAKSIDKFYKVCGENGIELPLLTNEEEMRSIEREIERNGHYN